MDKYFYGKGPLNDAICAEGGYFVNNNILLAKNE